MSGNCRREDETVPFGRYGIKRGMEMAGMFQRGFSQDGSLVTVLYRLSDLFLLNILWIFFSLPIVTAGASTAALYTVTLKMRKNQESYIFRSFVKAFRKNFRQGTALWLIYVLAGGILFLNLYIAALGKLPVQAFFLTVYAIMTNIYLMVGSYLFPVMAKFDTTIRQILKISLFLSLRHIGYTLMIILITAVPYLVVGAYLYLLPILFIITISGTAYISSGFFNKIFSKYIAG